MKAQTWTIAYRIGGTENFQWRKTLAIEHREQADRLAREIAVGGRKALVFPTDRLESIGLPETYEYETKRKP